MALLAGCNEQTVRKQGFEMHGIDVSHYQQTIDWALVASQNVDFAFVKATEGLSHQDSLFCQNWDAIKEAGLKRGAYHFFRANIDAKAQAENFIDLATLGNGDLAPVLDVETLDGADPEALRLAIGTWLALVENHFKAKPILYSNQNFFNEHLAGHFPGHPIWIARYSSWRQPRIVADGQWQFWQYGNSGSLRGISGPVDLNVFRGSPTDLDELCLVRPEPLYIAPPTAAGEVVVAP